MEIDTFADLRVDNADPDNLPIIQLWDVHQPPLARCGPGAEGVFVGLANLFTAHADAFYQGISCGDPVAQAHAKLDRAIRTANVAAAAAAGGCIGANIGWLGCIGTTWLGGFFADGISWEYGQWRTCGYWPGWTGRGI
jgi:hypothetical protein